LYCGCERNIGVSSSANCNLAGATIHKPAQDTDWGGYSGYFADLDGYLWEVAWNPHFDLTNGWVNEQRKCYRSINNG
jgi:hypothetical protein